jgi:hypothetical protein
MTSIVEADLPEVSLPASGWELRIGRGPRWRPALEVHTGDGLIDVAVAGGLDSGLLRGALRGRSGGQDWALAWGHLTRGDRDAPTVEFRNGRGVQHAAATVVAEAFWVAEVPGTYRSVTVKDASRSDSVRLRRYRASRHTGSDPR